LIVLDTHVVFWLAHAPSELSTRAKAAISAARARGAIYISDKTLWELAILLRSGRIEISTSVLAFLEAVQAQFQVLPVTPAIAVHGVRFSEQFPRDPADRIIAATAVVHQAPLLTRDQRIHASGEVQCIW
jgi:PIN domain nuclease of toxin-antitoxin system